MAVQDINLDIAREEHSRDGGDTAGCERPPARRTDHQGQ